MVNSRTSDMIVIALLFFRSVHFCKGKPLLRDGLTANSGGWKIQSRCTTGTVQVKYYLGTGKCYRFTKQSRFFFPSSPSKTVFR